MARNPAKVITVKVFVREQNITRDSKQNKGIQHSLKINEVSIWRKYCHCEYFVNTNIFQLFARRTKTLVHWHEFILKHNFTNKKKFGVSFFETDSRKL